MKRQGGLAMQVKEIMHKGIDSIAPDCSVSRAARLMKRRNIGMLPICEKGVLLGVLTDRDIVTRIVATGADANRRTVASAMTGKPVCAYQEAELGAATRRMEEKRIRRIPVVDRHERLVGMLSIDDLTRRGAGRDLVAEVLESAAARHA
ncbi:MAG: CBS domain-containing protein [Elusimicrobia bacterium]|nr:CBS domain-containing protein [Elusimicrobiota bacterium]MDE2424798.1 CBS domain-containing protein [Elusimicrobiota bacterium]